MKVETKVGLLFLTSIVMIVGFAYYLGMINPFSDNRTLHIMYNFAGGIEVGSPVRVMGIKVGKVEAIKFDPEMKLPDGEEVKLRVSVSISKEAWPAVRENSQFYINLAGVIGEKFIEVSPGSMNSPALEDGTIVRGEDPPRIDQLLSQGYGLAGKVMDLIERNEGSISSAISQIDGLLTKFNETLRLVDKVSRNKEIARLLENAVKISDDVAAVSGKLSSKEAEKTYDLIYRLIWRLEDFDATAIRQFLQEEGIKARIF